MLVDDLKEQLKNVAEDLATIKTFWQQSGNEERFTKLHTQSTQEDFWQNPQQAEILKELQHVKEMRQDYLDITQGYDQLHELLDMFSEDETELNSLKPEVFNLCKKIRAFKLQLLLSDPADKENCFISINAGAGGTESQDWASILLRMYVRFCERERFHVSIVDYQEGEGAGIKSATLHVKGKNAYGFLKTEHGIHRLVRISPFDANKRRHTSFSAVYVIPEMQLAAVTINPADLRIDTYRAGGAGGQHVNKTESAVRITHIPTNTVTQCQSERSQAQNKEVAMKMLMAKLVQRQKDEAHAQQEKVEKKAIEWGSQIRSYVLHPYKMVKDHRTDHESPQPDLVLDGDLMPFIEAALVQEGAHHTTP